MDTLTPQTCDQGEGLAGSCREVSTDDAGVDLKRDKNRATAIVHWDEVCLASVCQTEGGQAHGVGGGRKWDYS